MALTINGQSSAAGNGDGVASRVGAPVFRAEIEATNHCNTRCLHCPHEAISRPRGRMSWETFATVVDKIRRYTKGDRFALSFSGMGEPLLNPDLFRFIEHVSADAETSFASNGALLNERNIERLIEAGLDAIYLSFNGDEPELFAKMMGGIPLHKVWDNARRAVELTRHSRLKLRANVSVTKVNQHRLSRIKEQLEDAGIGPVTISLCHSRGGNLRDPAVCDTPAMGAEPWTCDVLQNTLFIDWRGQTFICDHDIHGEYGLGDLMAESLEVVLARRQRLLDEGVSFKICRECNDIMRVGNVTPLASGAGGIFRDWIYHLHREEKESLSEATPPLKWIYRIYEKENRLDRMVNRLLEIEKTAARELTIERRDSSAMRGRLATEQRDNEAMRSQLAEKNEQIADLKRQLSEFRQSWTGRALATVVRARNWMLQGDESEKHQEGVGRPTL